MRRFMANQSMQNDNFSKKLSLLAKMILSNMSYIFTLLLLGISNGKFVSSKKLSLCVFLDTISGKFQVFLQPLIGHSCIHMYHMYLFLDLVKPSETLLSLPKQVKKENFFSSSHIFFYRKLTYFFENSLVFFCVGTTVYF